MSNTKRSYLVGNMDCAGCAREVETGVARLDGIQFVEVNFATSKMIIEGDVPYEQLRTRVESLGKTLHEMDDRPDSAVSLNFVAYLWGRHDTRMALLGGLIVLLTLGLGLFFEVSDTVHGTLLTLAMVVAGYPIALSGVKAAVINRMLTINFLMSIAGVGAVLIGEHLEAAIVIFLFAIGEALEGYTAEKARRSLSGLMDLRPSVAHRVQPDSGVEIIPVDALHVGETVLIKPGERVPVDAELISGETSLDESTITGESIPVHKTVGDTLYAGTLNGDGAVYARVTRRVEDSTLARIIYLVEEAQGKRANTQRVIDRFAAVYTPAVVLMALLVATIPPLFLGQPFYDTQETQGWFYRALAMLVIACPCSLVISTPVTIISAITAAARHGVLIKGGIHLEALGTVRTVAFDKTGTLTRGKPSLKSVHALDCTGSDSCDACVDLLALAAALERNSTHPLAHAIVQGAAQFEPQLVYTAENVRNLSGQGIQGRVNDALVTVGSHAYFDTQFPHHASLCNEISELEQGGQTTMLVYDGQRVRGYLGVADEVRPESSQAIKALAEMNIRTVMLTGDNPRVAAAIAERLGVTDFKSELLPSDKVRYVEELKRENDTIAMIGDGINDTPALAASSVGIAMGGAGSAQAMETADVVLMADDLSRLPYLLKLSRFVRRLIQENIMLTFIVKLLFLSLAVMGVASLWLAILADVGMALLVTANGMRPLRFEAGNPADD